MVEKYLYTNDVAIVTFPLVLGGDSRQVGGATPGTVGFCESCMKVTKALTQYQRILEKLGKKLSPNRVSDLNKKRDAGTITVEDLPGGMEYPGGLGRLVVEGHSAALPG